MSQGVFINTLNTYIGTALYEEFLGEKPEDSEYTIYSTYFEKEESTKPLFVKKMMKPISKPGLFRKYILEKFDVMIYDMHSGRLADLKQCIKALTKAPLEKEKIVIMISSILSWGKTEPKMVEEKPKKYIQGDDGQMIEDIVEDDDDEDKDDKDKDNKDSDNMDGNSNDADKDLSPEEKELKMIMDKIDLKEDYLNNSKLIDEDGNELQVNDEEGNPLEREDEGFMEILKKMKLDLRIQKLKMQKKEIKVRIKL